MVEVTEEEVKNSVKLIPSWTTVVRGSGAEGSLVLGGPGHCLRFALCWAPVGGQGHLVCQPQCWVRGGHCSAGGP